MKTIQTLFAAAGRFAVGFGCGLALVCAFVIVTTDIGLGTPKATPPEVVRLEPIVVTIAPRRFSEIEAELVGLPAVVRAPDRGPGEG